MTYRRWTVASLSTVAVLATLTGPTGPLAASIFESFDGPSGWAVTTDVSGRGTVTWDTAQTFAGGGSAQVATTSANDRAAIRVNFADAASSHTWQERPGTWFWQAMRVYVPASTIAQLGPTEYFTLGGLWPSNPNTYGWFLRVRQNGALYVVGFRDWDNALAEFPVYGTVPQDRWFELELGLHSQAGPGVKRAFAFLIDGDFYGWYHQGRMKSEVYDRAAVGVLDTNSNDPLRLYVDEWGVSGGGNSPTGTDRRATANLQEQDYRTGRGVGWQIDWTTWSNFLRLDPRAGLYSQTDRLQSGRNLDRMPNLSDGWAEIEVDWPGSVPPARPDGAFAAMVGFRKEINREQNLEVIPLGRGGGLVDLAFQAWDGTGPVLLNRWTMPLNASGASAIPEPGDIIRARWQAVGPSLLEVRASYFDASRATWHTDILTGTYNLSNINGVNFFDGNHTASSITIDSPYYSIRRYKVGTLDTYPGSTVCAPTVSPASQTFEATGGSGAVTITAAAGCSWTVTSNDPWILLTSADTGSGNGTVSYSVAPNTTLAARDGSLTVAGQNVAISQKGLPCTFSIDPTAALFASAGGSGTTSVSAADGCGWTAVSNTSWIAVTSGSTGSGAGSVGYSVASNPSSLARAGSLTIAGQTVTVTQAGAPCAYAVTPTAVLVPAAGGAGTLTVTAVPGCGWTATTTTAWLGLTTASTGTGSGTVGYSVAVNPTASERVGTLNVAGQTVTVTQSAATAAATPVTLRLPVGAPLDDVDEVNAVLTSDATTVWIGNGGSTSTSYTGLRFRGLMIPRGATVTSARLEVYSTENQWITLVFTTAGDASGDSAAFSPTARPSLRPLTTSRVSHSSNVAWLANTWYALDDIAGVIQEVVNRSDWQSGNALSLILQGGGSGAWGRKFAASFDAGAATSPHLVVTYSVSSCTFSLDPTVALFASAGGLGTVSVSAPDGCGWTAVSNTSWISVPTGSSGVGAGSVGYSVEVNPSSIARTGVLTIAGQTLTVTQAGAACAYAVAPTSAFAPAGGGAGELTVTAVPGCAWSATAEAPWLTVTSGASGTGSGTVGYSVASNPTQSERIGALNVAGQTVTVTQSAATVSTPATVTLPLGAAVDDVNEVNGVLTSDATAVWIGNGGSTTTSYAGLRFTGVTIPRGATVTSAQLQVYSIQNQWITLVFTTAADASGNSAPFSATARPSLRQPTTSRVSHNSNVTWFADTWYALEDITSVIQEVVNRSDWQSGNALSLILQGGGSGLWGRKFLGSFEGGVTTAPRLVVTYVPN